ncbi:sialate O-acetylesterase [Coraliomargarita sp. W4R72]
MKKNIAAVLLFFVGVCTAFAAEWTIIDGEVTNVRHGQHANFYTVTSDAGVDYLANSAHTHVGKHEALFQQAAHEERTLHLEFLSHEKHPNSIWAIRRIEFTDTKLIRRAVPETDQPSPVVSELPTTCSVSAMFQDGMVLQRGVAVPIWGWAPPGTSVIVTFANQKMSALSDANGRWQVALDPLTASFVSREMRIQAASVGFDKQISDVLVGEVWVLSGQSNMAWWVDSSLGGKDAAAGADYPWLRYFDAGFQLSDTPSRDLSARAGWEVCQPANAGKFSAVGFWMAQRLYAELEVPIGLIKNAVSGTYGECWVPQLVLKSIPEATKRLDEYAAALNKLPQEKIRFDDELSAYQASVDAAKQAGEPEPTKSFFLRKGPMGPNHFQRPYALYNGCVAPIMPYAVRGVVWYQGEGNSQKHRAVYYESLLEGLVNSWRAGWEQEALPFLVVQLPRFVPGAYNDWPQLRETQRLAAARLDDTHLVVTIDTGEAKQIHPTDKAPVAKRVADLALQEVYAVSVSGRSPSPISFESAVGKLVIRFEDVGSGLIAREGAPRCFEIAASDGVFVPADASIIAPDQIELTASTVHHAVKVRYAYSNVPDVNVFSSSGLPLVPFVWESEAEIVETGYGPEMPVPTYLDVPYGAYPQTRLDFWQADTIEPAPLLVYIHGGSWLGNKRQMIEKLNVVQFCLKNGISVATIDYRYSTDAILPAPVHDAARSVQFLRSMAEEWNLDSSRILLQGGSAGACSALWIGLHDDLADLSSSDPVLRYSTRVSGVIAQSGQTSIDPRVVEEWIGPIVWDFNMFSKAVGAINAKDFKENYTDYEPLLVEFSPINHLDAADPPIFLSFGASLELPPKSVGHGIHHGVFGQKMKERADVLGQDTRLQIGRATDLQAFYFEILK